MIEAIVPLDLPTIIFSTTRQRELYFLTCALCHLNCWYGLVMHCTPPVSMSYSESLERVFFQTFRFQAKIRCFSLPSRPVNQSLFCTRRSRDTTAITWKPEKKILIWYFFMRYRASGNFQRLRLEHAFKLNLLRLFDSEQYSFVRIITCTNSF